MKREPMSLESKEMKIHGFAGLGTVFRHENENFIIVGRDFTAIKKFWKRWRPEFVPSKKKCGQAIVVRKSFLK